MRIVGHGIDAVEICRIDEFLRSPERNWATAIFSAAEREQADEPPLDARYYAGRFAAKEAVSKALGTGFSGEVTVHGIETLRLPNGAPEIRLTGGALAFANTLGITRWLISISHPAGLAMASVIAITD
jgi:holo-[acyl-carrier protein] synthase